MDRRSSLVICCVVHTWSALKQHKLSAPQLPLPAVVLLLTIWQCFEIMKWVKLSTGVSSWPILLFYGLSCVTSWLTCDGGESLPGNVKSEFSGGMFDLERSQLISS